MSGNAEEPGPLEPTGVIAALERHGVRYVVIGGVAAQLHGSPAPTRGLDVTPERSAPNLARLAAALASVEAREWVPGFGYPLQLPMDRRRLAGNRVLLTQTRYGRVDVVPTPHGVPDGYNELQPRARPVVAYGSEPLVASVDDLMRSHAAASRGKDAQALLCLREIKQSVAERGVIPPHELTSPMKAERPEVSLHDAFLASARLATLFDDIRPSLAYVRRELFRAVEEAMYGDEKNARTSISRARDAVSISLVDIEGLRRDLSPAISGNERLYVQERPRDHVTNLAHQAYAEVAMGKRLLASAIDQRQSCKRDDVRDLLIEARLHVAAADNHLDLLQIQLERVARGWEREPSTLEGRRERE